ncbi:MAG: GTP-binding protein [Pseudomonadota bacterium]
MKAPMQIPITVIGGHLGAGKTTLVNHLLRAANGLRLAIMVNEFGDLPIDEALIEAQGDDMIALAGGCVCCSYGDDLMAAMQQMAAMAPPPEHIVLEASGVALPGSIASSLSLLPHVVDDGIVVLADAETVRNRAQDKYMYDTVLRQLADADLIVLNKTDLVDSPTRDHVRAWLIEQAPEAVIVESEHSLVEPELVLQSFIGRARGAYLTNAHRNRVKSHVMVPEAETDAETLAAKLAQDETVVRAKGFVHQDNTSKLIQVVGKRWAVSDFDTDKEAGVVVIQTLG